MSPSNFKGEVAQWFQGLQDRICTSLEEADGIGHFHEDRWERPEGGGGRSRIMEAGALIEKGGVNFSAVEGPLPEKIRTALSIASEVDFFATGVSIVMHPFSPRIPIIHMNVRYFELSNGIHWFGGGIDLTPIYIDLQEAAWFHQQLKNTCDAFDEDYYPAFKKWADDYFYIKHRKETRGVGGIFFDRLAETEKQSREERFEFVKAVGESFAPIYTNILKRKKSLEFSEEHKNWQALRRGRYVEFNLVWDKGTKFGLDTDGRTESILMSMPPVANWKYNHQPVEHSPEADTLKWLRKGINWTSL